MERETLHHMLRDMLLSRAFEERAAEEYSKGNIVGFLHLYPGEEAVAAGVINATGPSDYIVSNYREHAHALVRGTPAREVMAELFGRATGMSKGHGRLHAHVRSRAPLHGRLRHRRPNLPDRRRHRLRNRDARTARSWSSASWATGR